MAKDKLQNLRGMRDFLPQQMIARQYVMGVARRIFESFGFEPLDTPAVEYADVLMGKYGPEADKLIYNFEDRGGRHVGLRYDLTVPLARVVSNHQELTQPFKRYQISPVWRAEEPQKGRYREFTQCDVDIVGAPPPSADAEIVATFFHVYKALGLEDVVIRLNHRQILVVLARAAGIPDDQRAQAFRSLDKLDKIPAEKVLEEMTGAGIERDAGERLLELTSFTPEGTNLQSLLERVGADESAQSAVREMEEILRLVGAMGIPRGSYKLDLSLVRGLDYYTGMILEAMLPELRSSVGGGGRYDNLIGMFGASSIPTVGVSVGLDRIIDILEARKRLPSARTVTHVLVTVFNAQMRPESLALADDIRESGIPTETFLLDKPLGKQFAYADRKGIPYAVVLGPDELEAGKVTMKDLRGHQQSTLTRAEMIAQLKTLSAMRDEG